VLGLILDNVIVFLYRIIRTGIGTYRSRKWTKTTGIVQDSHSPKYPYPFANFYYSYNVDGADHSGEYIKGFWFDTTAKLFADRFPPGRQIVIRYRPDNPAQSFLREDDQLTKSSKDPRDAP
jgi:hypothetical protein